MISEAYQDDPLLELSFRDFKITIIKMPKIIAKKNEQQRMNFNRERLQK